VTPTEGFGWGAVGAFINSLVAFIIPELVSLLNDDKKKIGTRRVGLFCFLALFLIAIGGFVTMAFSPADPKTRLLTGLGWQGLLKGLMDGGSAVLKPHTEDNP